MNALNPHEYQVIVAPALQVCAELAAQRGDPTLAADLPSMLALYVLVADLADIYWEKWGIHGISESHDILRGAPNAACVMVLQEAKMPLESIRECVDALARGAAQLRDAGVVGAEHEHTLRAWQFFAKSQRSNGIFCLRQAAAQIAMRTQTWLQARE